VSTASDAVLSICSLIETIDPTIRVARGYTCSSVEDLLAAYTLIGSERVVVKPIYGAAGEGIIFVRSVEELRAYTFPMGDVCLEEHLNLDVAPDGVVLSPALHYNEGELVGEDLVDQIMNGTAYMGWRRTVAPAAFQERARDVLKSFIAHTRPGGPGGVDFLSVGGEPYLSDLNTVSLERQPTNLLLYFT
jgi:formate-dependent phosphoribosylglycinamide formyltransferase (GAR transformylase)